MIQKERYECCEFIPNIMTRSLWLVCMPVLMSTVQFNCRFMCNSIFFTFGPAIHCKIQIKMLHSNICFSKCHFMGHL